MGECEEDEVDLVLGDEIPGEGVHRGQGAALAEGEVRVQVFEGDGAGFVGCAAEEEGRRVLQARVGEEQAGELAAGVAADSGYGGAGRVCVLRRCPAGRAHCAWGGHFVTGILVVEVSSGKVDLDSLSERLCLLMVRADD